jgi:hypothetical protein
MRAFLGLAALVAAAGADAQEAKCRFGLQASLAAPVRASYENYPGLMKADGFLSAGMSVAGTVEWRSGPNGAVRARVEYLSFGGRDSQQEVSEPYFGGVYRVSERVDYGIRAVALAADYVYSFEPNGAGAYAFGGVGYYITSGGGSMYATESLSGVPGYDFAADATHSLDGGGSSAGASLGVGWRLAKGLACELRLTTLTSLTHTIEWSWSQDGTSNYRQSANIGLSWLQAGICYRF